MDLADALAPLTVAELRDQYYGRRPLALVRNTPIFQTLLTLEQVEARLNDACGSSMNLFVIGENGSKLPREAVYAAQREGGWTREFVKKSEVKRFLAEGKSFVMHNMAHVTPEVGRFVASIEQAFPKHHCDLHIYVSPSGSSTAYNVHRDFPQHKIYLQLLGTTRWTVYRGTSDARSMTVERAEQTLERDFEARITPGSVLYLPPGVFHRATNDGPRVSLSFPFHPHPTALPVDRTHIPLGKMFER